MYVCVVKTNKKMDVEQHCLLALAFIYTWRV